MVLIIEPLSIRELITRIRLQSQRQFDPQLVGSGHQTRHDNRQVRVNDGVSNPRPSSLTKLLHVLKDCPHR